MADETSFVSAARENFGFLTNELGYTLHDRRLDPTKPWSDGVIEFSSPRVTLRIQKDRGSFILLIKPANEPEISAMSLPWVLEAIGVAKRGDFPGEAAPKEFVEVLKINARLLKTYCADIINGNFSTWLSILEFFVKESKRSYLAETKRKIPDRIHRNLEEYIKSHKLGKSF